MLQFLGVNVDCGGTECISHLCHRFFTQSWTSPSHTPGEVGITFQDEGEFPPPQALASSGSEWWSVSERGLNI